MALAFLLSLVFGHAFFGHADNRASGGQGVPVGLSALRQVPASPRQDYPTVPAARDA
jgi:hypothetical protein